LNCRHQKALFLDEKCGKFIVGTDPRTGNSSESVQAAAVNPVDWKYGSIQTLPAIIGFDIAGDVEELGEIR
jgi:hypothetical protein